MSPTIWKFPLRWEDEVVLVMPRHARILTVQMQRGEPMLWALVDASSTELVERKIGVFGTGAPVDGAGKHIGTLQDFGGDLVFHVFDEGEGRGVSPEASR